jgi:hypothetical protein
MTCSAFPVQHGRHCLPERVFQLLAFHDFSVYFILIRTVILLRGVNILHRHMGYTPDQVRRRRARTQ